MNDGDTFYRADWMTDDQWSAANLIADVFGGFHHLRLRRKGRRWWIFEPAGTGVIYRDLRSMSTFDAPKLTHLVILAHERCVRVEIAARMNYLEIMAHQRKGREGRYYERHWTLDDAVKALSPQRTNEQAGK